MLLMGSNVNTVEQFRAAISVSIARFYGQRGLSGASLRSFAGRLQQKADELHVLGWAPCAIKQELAGMQAHLLKFPKPLAEIPPADANMMMREVWQSSFFKGSLSPSKKAFAFQRQKEAVGHLFGGRIGFEGLYSGFGERLQLDKSKFMITVQDLLKSLRKFMEQSDHPLNKKLLEQIKEHGGIEAIAERFGKLRDFTIGDRIFIAKAFDLVKKAEMMGKSEEEIGNILSNIKFKVVLNKKSGGQIIDHLIRNRFFGFCPSNFIFMVQPEHPTHKVNDEGAFEPDQNIRSQGNHGLTVFHSNLEGQWFRVIPGEIPGAYREERLSAEDYKQFQEAIDVLLVESVEDTAQYLQPIDYGFVRQVMDGAEGSFHLQIAGQKTLNPQPGGIFRKTIGRHPKKIVVESNRIPGIKLDEVRYIYKGWGGIKAPNKYEQSVIASGMIWDLHPTFKPKYLSGHDNPFVRVEMEVPLVDSNLYDEIGKSYYMIGRTIENLKDPLDIIPALIKMEEMEKDRQLMEFAKERSGRQQADFKV